MPVLHCPVCRHVIELPADAWEIDVEMNDLANECNITVDNMRIHECVVSGGGSGFVREPRRPVPPPPRMGTDPPGTPGHRALPEEQDADDWLRSQTDE